MGGKPEIEASRLRLLGVALLCAKVALVPLAFDSTADVPFVIPKALVSHALAYALTGILIGLFVQLGRTFFVWSWLHVPVLAFLGANVLATVFAADKLLALYGAHVRMLGLGTIADSVVLYFAIVLLVRKRSEALAVIATAVATSAIVLLYEAAQLARVEPISFGVDASSRPFSTIGQVNSLAVYLTVMAVGVAAFALLQPRLLMPLRVGLLGYSVLLVVGVVPTLTRAAFIGLAAGSAVLVLLVFFGHPSRRARLISLVGAGATTFALLILIMFTPLGARLVGTIAVGSQAASDPQTQAVSLQVDESAQTRLSIYRIAFEMVRERPILGFGPDNLMVGVPRFRAEHEASEVQQSQPTSAHSWVAHIAASSGLLGLGSFLATIGAALFLTLKRGFRLAAWAGMAMIGAFLGAGLLTISDISTEWLVWASFGMVAAATAQPAMDADAPVAAGRPRPTMLAGASPRRLVAWAFSALGLAMVVFAPSALEASRRAEFALESRLAGRYVQAVDPGLVATRLDPGRAEYWEGLGLAYIGTQRVAEAAAAFEEATKLSPYNVSMLGQLARSYLVLAQRGDAAAAEKARLVAERVAALDPNNPRAHHTKALVMQVTGNQAQALRSIERALALDPQSSNAQLLLTGVQVMVANDRTADGIALARTAISTLPDAQDTVAIRVELARALATSGQPAQALAEIDAALAIRPTDPAALQLRTQLRAGVNTR